VALNTLGGQDIDESKLVLGAITRGVTAPGGEPLHLDGATFAAGG